jgi:SOS-response transcriptional repressor LexA
MTAQAARLTKPDDDSLMALHEAGKSTREIATALGGISYATVSRRLKHLTPRKSTEIFKTHKADILSEMQRKILSTCNVAAIKEMCVRDRFTAFGILHDKEQAERGLAGNQAHPMVVIQIRGVEASCKQGYPQINASCQQIGDSLPPQNIAHPIDINTDST